MAHLSDLKLKYRLLIQSYPFRRVDWRPGTLLRKPLNRARTALITTAGFYLPDQKPFDQSYRHDDCSFREIPWGAPVSALQIAQSSDAFDHSGIVADRNLALPLDRLRELGPLLLFPKYRSDVLRELLATYVPDTTLADVWTERNKGIVAPS